MRAQGRHACSPCTALIVITFHGKPFQVASGASGFVTLPWNLLVSLLEATGRTSFRGVPDIVLHNLPPSVHQNPLTIPTDRRLGLLWHCRRSHVHGSGTKVWLISDSVRDNGLHPTKQTGHSETSGHPISQPRFSPGMRPLSLCGFWRRGWIVPVSAVECRTVRLPAI